MDETLPTMFAPAERVDDDSIDQAHELLVKTGLLDHITHILPCAVVLLNRERQIVYANRGLLDLAGTSSVHEVLGKRPGELLDCIHANETSHGCGTTKFCRECGAVKAILKSQKNTVSVRGECVVTSTDGNVFEFIVNTSPYNVAGEQYTVFSLEDHKDYKRRLALERTFFHDVNNTLSVILGHASLLHDLQAQGKLSESIKSVELASRQLVDEVVSHQKMLSAENGELAVNITAIKSAELVREVMRLYSEQSIFCDRTVVCDGNSENVEITTDQALLQRVLGNMVKNALEAASPGETVRAGCVKDDRSVTFSVFNPNPLSQRVQLQMFNRSFSTKEAGRGLGTYSMKLFGERYLKGKVWFATSKKGTTFYISVPIVFPES